MGLYLLDMMFSIFRGHIPGSAARTATPAAIPPGAFMGVLAAATLAVALLAMSLWAVVWLAIRLI